VAAGLTIEDWTMWRRAFAAASTSGYVQALLMAAWYIFGNRVLFRTVNHFVLLSNNRLVVQ